MKRKLSFLCACLLLAMGLAACNSGTTDSGTSTADSLPSDSTESIDGTVAPTDPIPCQIGYVTGHGEMDVGQLTSFISQVEQDGYEWEEVSLTAIPEDTDILIINSPTQDISDAELNALNAYSDEGRHLLFLLPANEAEVRYKNFSNHLDRFCLQIDYNHITETDSTRILEDNPGFILADIISYPTNMTLYSEQATSGTPFLLDARSFHFMYQDNFSTIKIDTMLQTAVSAIGTPCGGTEDDPLTFENEKLTIMGYSRDEGRNNACVVAVGASNFLTDTYYHETYSRSQVDLVHSSLGWFRMYSE